MGDGFGVRGRGLVLVCIKFSKFGVGPGQGSGQHVISRARVQRGMSTENCKLGTEGYG